MAFNPTPEQQAILGHDLRQHARILAGPGTGKSATVIALLDAKAGALGGRAKLITFTRAATAELVLKLDENPNIAVERPSTLHSFCISVLLRNPGLGEFPRPLRMADDWERDQIVEETLSRRLDIPKRRVNDLFGELAANWESLAPTPSPKVTDGQRARFMGGWQEHRQVFGYTLPSELPYALRTALEQHAEMGGLDYQLLVVDEYQDLNSCDLDVLTGIAERGCRIIAAGDDDQSIYSFRKAHPEGIRRFLGDYPGASDYPLSVTQRCGRSIVRWANYVIQGDPGRPATRAALNAAPGTPDGEVGLFSFAGEVAEATGVAEIAASLIAERHLPPSEILILTRSDHNGQFSKGIKTQLSARGIPFSDPSSIDELMETPEVRIVMSHLRLLVDRNDSLAWATLLILASGIGDAFIDFAYEAARARRITFGAALLELYGTNFAGAPRASAGKATILLRDTLARLEAVQLPEQAPENGWGSWIVEMCAVTGLPLSEDMRAQLAIVDGKVEPSEDLGRYIGQIWLVAKDDALAKANGVRIMTLAASKGLTGEAAILVGLENGIVPMDGRDLAEERRLLYVGMTRARRFLIGTWARRRKGPTARAGRAHAGLRQLSQFLQGGPINTENK